MPRAKKWNGAVYSAARSGDSARLSEALLTHGQFIDTPHPTSPHETPMHAAVAQGHTDAIETLVRLGSKALDTPDKEGRTPIYYAATNILESQRVVLLETLIRLGSKAIDTPDNYGWTPMQIAIETNSHSVIEALVRLGSKAIYTPDKYGNTPLQIAVHRGNANVIKTLLRFGSNADQTLKEVMWWYCNLNAECIKLLIAASSTPTSRIKNSAGEWFELTEEEVAELRYEVYFGESLVRWLLCDWHGLILSKSQRQ